jgi:GDP-4-dehydro-6-deoxy-D-mannose reductase
MKALITGINGFIGGHLAERLLETGWKVVGLSRASEWPIGADGPARKVELSVVDLADRRSVDRFIRATEFDALFHCAGQANVPYCEAHPDECRLGNVDATRHLIDSLLEHRPTTAMLHLSTGQVHGQPEPGEPPLSETSPIRPQNEYARSKAAADELVAEAVADRGARIVTVRLFNNIGPRQDDSFVVPRICRAIAEFERTPAPKGSSHLVRVGRLDVERDFTDVRDAVKAFPMLIESKAWGETFNAASGQTRSVRSLVDRLTESATTPIRVEVDQALVRPADLLRVEVSTVKIKRTIGWSAKTPIETTLADTLDYWRRRVEAPVKPR